MIYKPTQHVAAVDFIISMLYRSSVGDSNLNDYLIEFLLHILPNSIKEPFR